MKILMINKFLHMNGGSETYMIKLGEYLSNIGHEVQYFGMEHEKRCVGNALNIYTNSMNFHTNNLKDKLTYPLRTIYSNEARIKLRKVLNDFKPDVCHLNNFNYQLTPSVILEIVRWRKLNKRACRIVFTAHDYQLVCPNHMLRNQIKNCNCDKCLTGRFYNCLLEKCIHGSAMKSIIGSLEAYIWNKAKVYRHIDAMICCSSFLKEKMDTNPLFREKTIALQNFAERCTGIRAEKKDYVLYFGRYSQEKGVQTLLDVCAELPEVHFIFAGSGPLQDKVVGKNIQNVGFQSGKDLEKLIREARFSICSSECYENCPFSVLESQNYGTPVLGSNIGGIPEIVFDGKTGELFEPGNKDSLKEKIMKLWNDRDLLDTYTKNCSGKLFNGIEDYANKLMEIYRG